MTEMQLRSWAKATLRKYGDDCIALGHRPAVKEQELFGFMMALIDVVHHAHEQETTARIRRDVKCNGGSFPRVAGLEP